MNPDVTDTEFVHFEVLAERPRRRRARRPLVLVAVVAVVAIAAVIKVRAARSRAPADVIPATELEARRAAAGTAQIPGC